MTLIGNIISFFGCILMVACGFIKRKDHMLAAQCGQFGLQSVANLMLGSVSGCVSGAVGIVRIVVFTRVKRVTVWLKVGFIALQGVLTWLSGAQTLVQWLPMLAMVAYTWYLDTENAVLFKFVNLLGVCMWLVHDIHYINYSAMFFDTLTILTTIVGMLLLLRDERKKREGEKNEKDDHSRDL